MPRPTACCLLLPLLAVSAAAGGGSSCQIMEVVQTWELGFSMNVELEFPVEVRAWNATLEFDAQLANLETWADQIASTDNRTYTIYNNVWDGGHSAGDVVTLYFVVDFQGRYDPAQLISVRLLGDELC